MDGFPDLDRRRRAGAGCSGCFALVLAPVMTCGIGGLVFGAIELSRRGSDLAAVAAFNACPAVTAALGTPIRESRLSMGCGEYEGGGSSGEADWTISLYGPKGSASGWYSAHFSGGGPWIVDAANVTVGGRTIPAVPCASAPAAPVERERPGGGGGGGKAGKRR